jgi:hypothetical protein
MRPYQECWPEQRRFVFQVLYYHSVEMDGLSNSSSPIALQLATGENDVAVSSARNTMEVTLRALALL